VNDFYPRIVPPRLELCGGSIGGIINDDDFVGGEVEGRAARHQSIDDVGFVEYWEQHTHEWVGIQVNRGRIWTVPPSFSQGYKGEYVVSRRVEKQNNHLNNADGCYYVNELEHGFSP